MKQKNTENDGIEALADRINAVRSIVTSILVFCLFSFTFLWIYYEYSSETVIVKSFDMPEKLAKNGYTGHALAKRFIDQIEKLNTLAASIKATSIDDKKQYVIDNLEKQPDIEIDADGISFKSIIKSFKRIFGKEPRVISGEILLNDSIATIITRVDHERVVSSNVAMNAFESHLDSLLFEAILDIYISIEPSTLASYYYQINDLDNCNKALQICFTNRSEKDDANAYHIRGNLFSDLANYEKAEELYCRAIRINPRLSIAYLKLGFVHFKQDSFVLAERYYKKALDIDPNLYIAYYNRALLSIQLKEYDEAIDLLNQTAKLKPTFIESYLELGRLYRVLEKRDKAISSFEKVLDLSDEDEYLQIARKNLLELENGR